MDRISARQRPSEISKSSIPFPIPMHLIKSLLFTVLLLPTLGATHPQILVTPEQHAAMSQKIATAPWAGNAYAGIKKNVDHYVAFTKEDPQWVVSRLAMNWDTHYTTPLTSKQRWVGGEGRAPVPTPRFAGARDWKTDFEFPSSIEKYKPYNDKEGMIYLKRLETGAFEWVMPTTTGHIIEKMNREILDLAAQAGFVYWVTGEERYARFASDILWIYMEGFSYKSAPRIDPADKGTSRIIGMNSFEVIHENIVTPLALTYDFCHDFLVTQGRDVKVIQAGLKRMIDRVVDGGGRQGNWNLNQARIIAYGGLSLEGNEAYEDGRGRPYYVDIVLNADLPHQLGILQVVNESVDPGTAMWAEAAGYGFGTVKDIFLLANLVGNDPAGKAVMDMPLLKRAIPAQWNIIFPDGWSTGIGDTYLTRMNAIGAELMIAAAHRSGDIETERIHTALLQREIADGTYNRNVQSGLESLAFYVDKLEEVPPAYPSARTTFATPFEYSPATQPGRKSNYDLAASLCGTQGGHVHTNGLSLELYGAGMLLAPDLGRGSSYWQPDHGEYYLQPPGHNTVIVDGVSKYSFRKPGQIQMTVDAVEPAVGAEGISPHIGFAQTGFAYLSPAAEQQRTLALVRLGPQSGFFVDIFRSRKRAKEDGFHDYVFHGVGQESLFTDADGDFLRLTSSSELTSKKDLLPGYKYFKNESSAPVASGFGATFTIDPENGTPKRSLRMWMPSQKDRTLFSVDAPGCRAFRDSLGEQFMEPLPMPSLLVRQRGNAWIEPFVAVFEPNIEGDPSAVKRVEPLDVASASDELVAFAVAARGARVIVMQGSTTSASGTVTGQDFHGSLGIVVESEKTGTELYLGHGQSLGQDGMRISSATKKPVHASLRRSPSGVWSFGATGPVKIELTDSQGKVRMIEREAAIHADIAL